MELSLKTFVLAGAVFVTGLSAGLFYAWSVSVIPGTQKVADSTYLETMQSINREILNPRFFITFFGSIVFLMIATIYQYQVSQVAFWLMLISAVIYLIGTFGVTAFGNVPLNDQLEALNLMEAGTEKMSEFREAYESNWNRLHGIRTISAIVSFLLATLSVLAHPVN